MALLWPIIGPPMSVRETFTTVPGRFGAAGEEPGRYPEPPGATPPGIIDGTGEGPPRVPTPTATVADATRAITAAARVATSNGRRLMAVTSRRPGHPAERPVGPARALGRSARWPIGDRGSPEPKRRHCGMFRGRCRAATARPATRSGRAL